MLQFVWGFIYPFLILGSLVGVLFIWRNWHRLKRVVDVVVSMTREMQVAAKSAWVSPPLKIADTPIEYESEPEPSITVPVYDTTTVPGAGSALLHPPSIIDTLRYMQHVDPDSSYLFPYGWFLNNRRDGSIPDLAYADLTETYNIGIIGPQQYGKTSLVLSGLIALTLQRKPHQIQFAFFDLKGMDFAPLESSQYTLLMIRTSQQISDGVVFLQNEIERRGAFLREHGLSNWKNYKGDNLALLVVYISELATLVSTMGQKTIDMFLNDLMGRGAAFGIRVIVDTHALKDHSTLWRNLLSDRLLGPGLRNPQQDLVNADMSTDLIKAQGAIPPSQLNKTHLGVFTIVTDTGQTLTVRSSFADDDLRQKWFSSVPQKIDALIETEDLLEPVPSEDLAIPGTSFAEQTAAQLYREGIEISVILAEPHVHEELSHLAKKYCHRNGIPNIRRVTKELFDVEQPSGTQQDEVKNTLLSLGLLEATEEPESPTNRRQTLAA